MKKIAFILVIALLITVTAIPVFANGTVDRTSTASRITAGTQTATRAGALTDTLTAIRKDLQKLRDEIRQNRLTNEGLRLENRELRVKLRSLIAENKRQLPKETLVQLKKMHQEMNELVEALADTKGDIRDILNEVKSLIVQKDWTGVKKAYRDVIDIQKNRTDKLEQINKLLKKMIRMVTA